MKKKTLITGLLLLYISIVSIGFAQDPRFEGEWTLKNIEITKDSANIISPVNYDITQGNNTQWNIYTSISFEKSKCSIFLNEQRIDGEFQTKENALTLDFISMAPKYEFSFEGTILRLYCRHYFYNKDFPEKGFLDIYLNYQKK